MPAPTLAELLDGDNLTLDQMRRIPRKQLQWEQDQDMKDSAKLQAFLSTPLPSQIQGPPQPPQAQPGMLQSLLALLQNPGKNIGYPRNIDNYALPGGMHVPMPNVYRGALQPRGALPQYSPSVYPTYQRGT